MPDATLRQITMLGLVPRRPPGITTQALRSALANREFTINLRTIQRDLNKLSAVFPLMCDDEDPPRWYWAPHAEALTLPGHDPLSALSWNLVEQYLQPLLPRSLAKEIEPHFNAARGYLNKSADGNFRRWSQRVRILPRSMSLQAPDIPQQVLDCVYQALLEKRQIEVAYTNRSSNEPRQLILHPIALVVRDSVHYLLATVADFTDIRQLVLHRMSTARLTEESANEPQDFDLEEYIRAGGFDYSSGRKSKLVARFDAHAGKGVLETPLGVDQTHRTLADGRIEVRATVNESDQLRWWLKGFGSSVEVIAPKALRDHMRQEAQAQIKAYTS